jgi:2,4-dienoyl-CoA reductase-like NADH-dependent reductase (Old Yellow Enzyme family)
MSHLLEPLVLRGVTLRNRIGMSPMCMYSAQDGHPGEWHLIHLGSRAVGGAALVMAEASAVDPAGRISPFDAGLWKDEHIRSWAPIVRFLEGQGTVAGIQIAHAGRKASTSPPWDQRRPVTEEEGGWQPLAPSPIPFGGYRTPRELAASELPGLARTWAEAAARARRAGFEVIEIHMAHGYLLHEFLSPLCNRRTDSYGGSLENRMRFPLEVTRLVRDAWPESLPLFVRISTTDWVPGGWDAEQSVVFSRELKRAGADLVDCSSGGAVPEQKVPFGPGYQVPFAERVRREAAIPTAAVGMITEPGQAEAILSDGRADLVMLGRELLRDPYWPLRASADLGHPMDWPRQYGWAVG